MTRIAFYPGTFDPVTNGHVDILHGALALADKVVVGVGINAGKSPLFSLDERLKMVGDMIRSLGRKDAARASAVAFDGLAVDAAARPARPCWFAACATPAISTTRCRWPA